MDAADGMTGGGGDTAVSDAAAADPTPVSDAAPVDPASPPVDAQTTDPNDPSSALEAAMKAELGEDAPAEAQPQVDQTEIPEAFQQALSLSPFVTEPARNSHKRLWK